MNHRPIDAQYIEGSYTALITPMKKGDGLSNPIDYKKLFRLVDDQFIAGIKGIVVAGTTGQGFNLSYREHSSLVERVFNYVSEKYPLLHFIAAAGSNCTREAIELSQDIERRIGPTTFLHVTGYYNNPPQEGILAHFQALGRAIPESNIILYNVPGRTSSKIEADTALRIIESVPNVIGIKDASGDLESIRKVINNTDPSRFVVLSGEDHLVYDIMKMGGKGVISASANLAPLYFVKMTNAALEGNFELAKRLQEEILPLVKQGVFYRKNPIPLAHYFDTEVRLPLVKLPQVEKHLLEVLSNYSFDDLGIDLSNYRPI